jgi:hypothetical protein
MGSLGSLFPQDEREKFSQRQIISGSVFRVFTQDTKPPKIKIVVILAVNDKCACIGHFFINSQVNPNVFPTKALKELHLFLPASENPFLKHDSYLDCSVIQQVDLQTFLAVIADDPQCYQGNLKEHDFEFAKKIARNAPTISKALKRKFNLI